MPRSVTSRILFSHSLNQPWNESSFLSLNKFMKDDFVIGGKNPLERFAKFIKHIECSYLSLVYFTKQHEETKGNGNELNR